MAVIASVAATWMVWHPGNAPTHLQIDTGGVAVADLAKADWDLVCFYPQFSNPEALSPSRSYAACPIWSDVEERSTLIVFSSPNGCEAFGVEGGFLSERLEEARCFFAEETARTRVVNQAGVIRLVE